MKALEFNYVPQGYHKEDIEVILKYLKERGTLNVSDSDIEDLYYDFSDTCRCSWRIVSDDSLAEFAEWLSEYELRYELRLR